MARRESVRSGTHHSRMMGFDRVHILPIVRVWVPFRGGRIEAFVGEGVREVVRWAGVVDGAAGAGPLGLRLRGFDGSSFVCFGFLQLGDSFLKRFGRVLVCEIVVLDGLEHRF